MALSWNDDKRMQSTEIEIYLCNRQRSSKSKRKDLM